MCKVNRLEGEIGYCKSGKDVIIKSAHPHFWEEKPLETISAKLNDYGVKSIVFNPCGDMPEKDDFLARMRLNIEELNSSLQ